MARKFYVTTAIPYVNGAPHVGHGLEAVQTDALARYHRQVGDDTYFLTGSDDNSITNVRAAEKEGIPVPELVARNTEGFIGLDRKLNVSYDQFIRTSVDAVHAQGATKLWSAVAAAGDLYQQDFVGLYCPSCELFYEEDELVAGLCPDHLTAPEQVQENNWFFRLSRFQEQLDDLISSDHYRVVPNTRKNEVLSFIRSGLRDFSVSRSMERARGWGIPVPDDSSQVMYVWFDALSNYITALDYAHEGDLYRRFWSENPVRVHCIGKGIIRFHAVYWPAMLLSAGVPLPSTLFVHGYYTFEGRKMSKSLGNTIDPASLVDKYGADAVRYFFLGATSATGDGDFAVAELEARYNADLANDLGNLLNRSVNMIQRYRAGIVPRLGGSCEDDEAILEGARTLAGRVAAAMELMDFQQALAEVWVVISSANRYIEVQSPWNLAKDESLTLRLDAVLGTLARILRLVAVNLLPFLPHAAGRILDQIGVGEDACYESWEWPEGVRVLDPRPIFPRLERAT
jgi:methionyl-tRNA synthetase